MVDNKDFNFALKIIERQYKEVDEQSGELRIFVGRDNDDPFKWILTFQGPEGHLPNDKDKTNIYDGGFFKAHLLFPQDYPNNPPKMIFISEMWHPNIYNKNEGEHKAGEVCISILHKPGVDQFNQLEREDEKWRPIITAEKIILSVSSMLLDPNINSPANIDASVDFQKNLAEYKKKVRKLTNKSIEEC